MNYSQKFYLTWGLWIVATIGVVIFWNWEGMFVWGLFGFAAFFYRGRMTTQIEVQEVIDNAVLKVKTNLVCEVCGQSPHLTETEDGKFACDKCYALWWARHCPICEMLVPDEWKGDQRQAHLDEHTKKGETEATFNKPRAEGSSA